MSTSPWKRQISGEAIGYLQARINYWKNGPHYESAIRNPAYCKVTSSEGGNLPLQLDTFDELYKPKLKIPPIIEHVSIKQGGDYGLTLECELTIRCHLKEDWRTIEKQFCKPGIMLTVQFGYGPRWAKDGYSPYNICKGLRVATYSFNTTSEGFWQVKIHATGPGAALEKLNMGVKIFDNDLRYKGADTTVTVTGFAELMAYDAQLNGTRSVDSAMDGQVVEIAGMSGNGGAALAIYNTKHLYGGALGGLKYLVSTVGSGNEVTETDNVVYYTLGYVVNRLINNQLTKVWHATCAAEDADDFKKLKILFDPDLSYSYPSKYTWSAYPTSVIIGGSPQGDYKYKGAVQPHLGKNFWSDSTEPGAIQAVVGSAGGGSRIKVDPSKILLERGIIISALAEQYEEPRTSESNELKNSKEGVVNVGKFFKIIFDQISKATGGQIKLRLAMHPDIHHGDKEDDSYKMYIFCESNGNAGTSLKCWVFDPIDHDGSTRSCQVTSQVGSSEYRYSMFAGPYKKSDPIMEAHGKMNNASTDGRTKEYEEAIKKIEELTTNPGELAGSSFGQVSMQAMEQALGTIRVGQPEGKQMDQMHYVGLGIDAQIDGIWGIYPGCCVSTTQLTKMFFDKKAYFFVDTVEHTFDGNTSDWETSISGKLSFDPNVQYLPGDQPARAI